MNPKSYILILMINTMLAYTACSTKEIAIEWNNELSLPPNMEMEQNVGLAGTFAGVVDGELLIAGGANFPVGFPWTGGTKTWWSTMYSKKLTDENSQWQVHENFLETPIGYGVSIQLNNEILFIGGCDKTQCYANITAVKKEAGSLTISKNAYPPLPVPLANACGVLIGSKIYILGGQEAMDVEQSTKHFFVLDINNKEAGWSTLSPWAGPSRGYAVCEAQGGKLYLFSGRSYGINQETVMYTDGHCYDPSADEWTVLEGEFPFMAGTAIPYGDDKILFLGGVDKILPTNPTHPGFSNDVSVFDVNTLSLSKLTSSPFPIAVTTKTVLTKDTFYIASGEVRPGIRTPHILKGIIK